MNVLDRLESVNATHAANDVSGKYKFVSTREVLDSLADKGWFPVSGYEKRANKPEYRGFQKHVIRLRKDTNTVAVGDSIVELLLVNSHNRGSSVQLLSGVFRMACSNGLVVSTGCQDASFRIRHIGYAVEKVYKALDHIETNIGAIHATIQKWRTYQLSDEHKTAFATQATLLRWESGHAVTPAMLLHTQRIQDQCDDLWTVFNVVQENMVKGGRYRQASRYTFSRGRYTTIRPVTGLDSGLKLNQDLWTLAESFAMTLEFRNTESLVTV